jgi:pentatricopeptide repeat protein
MMFTNMDIVIPVVGFIAVCMSVPSGYWSFKYICSDLGLYFFAIVAYAVLSRFRGQAPAKKTCEEEECTTLHESSCDYVEDVAEVEESGLSVAKVEPPQFDVNKHVAEMQAFASARNIAGTMKTFRLIQKSGECLNSLMYNTVLQAWINCGNVQAAEDWMEDITEAAMADVMTFTIIIKALVSARAVDKAKGFMRKMRSAALQPNLAIFNEVLNGLTRESRCDEGLALLEEMHRDNVHPCSITLNTMVKMFNSSRSKDMCMDRVRRVLCKYNLEAHINGVDPGGGTCISSVSPVSAPLPRLAAVMSQAEDAKLPAHEMHVTGSLSQIKAVRRTLKQHGFLDKSESECWPLDGHWETDHGLTVIIEGKVVRWSGQRASRLRFTNEDRSACVLALYGEPTRGQLASSDLTPQSTKMIRWENGDVWHSYDGRVIGQDTLFLQTMSKTLRDIMQDKSYMARSVAMMRCVSKQALGVPSILEDTIMQFLGNDLYFVRVQFESKWNPSPSPSMVEDDDEYGELPPLPSLEEGSDICNAISRRHPRVGLRHCWAEKGANRCGQRTVVNGEEVDEDSFARHVKAVCWA